MKFWFVALLAMFLLVNGCVFRKGTAAKTAPAKQPPAPTAAVATEKKSEAEPEVIVTPENLLVGKVATFNTAGRFVVLDFPVGKLPTLDQVMFVYRQGLKVGEVKIVGPERDHMTIGDLIAGEARKGDDVRDK
jgi:hypothetical protein